MSQHDFDIANQTAPSFRADLNDALKALASLSSGPSEPDNTYANMLWYNTASNLLRMRNESDSAWITIGTLNQSTNEFEVANLTTLTTATWQTGTNTTESLVSPAKVKAAIQSNVTTTTVNTAIASSSIGGVGTYAMLGSVGRLLYPGSTIAGSNLAYGGTGADTFDSNDFLTQLYGNPSGTWRCMGLLFESAGGGNRPVVTLFLRIS